MCNLFSTLFGSASRILQNVYEWIYPTMRGHDPSIQHRWSMTTNWEKTWEEKYLPKLTFGYRHLQSWLTFKPQRILHLSLSWTGDDYLIWFLQFNEVVKNLTIFFLKLVNHGPSVYFGSFQNPETNNVSFQFQHYNRKKYRFRAQDSNPGTQGGKRIQIYCTMAAPQTLCS